MRRSTITRAVSAALLAAAVGPLGASTASAEASTVVDVFSQGTNAGTAVTGGTVQLQAPLDETFDGTTLPTGWTSKPWAEGGTATVGGGSLTVDGTSVDTGVAGGPGTVLDVRATLAAEAYEHIGFAADFNAPPWALFSTSNQNGPDIYARTSNGTTQSDTPISGLAAQAHNYRIAWTASGVVYYVDGNLVPATPVALTGPLAVQASDANAGGGAIAIESMKLTNATGTYTSGVLDGGPGFVTGITLTATADTPPGSTIAYETRTGSTGTPDGSWSDWAPVGAGGVVASPSRYLQYRATLTLNTAPTTPAISRVAADFAVDDQGPASSVSDVAVNGTGATAHFSSDDASATYECRLDGGAFSTCTSPATFSGLSAGTHTFSVRGTDAHGNVGAVASRQFTIAAPSTGSGGQPPASNPGGSGASGNSSTPPASGTEAVTARDNVAPRLRITPKSVRVSRSGKVALKVKCPSGETRCKVTMRLKLNGATVAKTTTTIRGGKTVTVSLKLSASARAKLARRGSLKVTARGTATDAAGNVKVTSIRITLKRALTHR